MVVCVDRMKVFGGQITTRKKKNEKGRKEKTFRLFDEKSHEPSVPIIIIEPHERTPRPKFKLPTSIMTIDPVGWKRS